VTTLDYELNISSAIF